MYGIEAITANNGWSMAIVGASLDFLGLIILSISISQLHKLLEYWENRKKKTEKSHQDSTGRPATGKAVPEIFPTDIHEVAILYGPLIERVGNIFQLTELYRLARENNYPHPHLTITSFREKGFLVPEGDGLFSWTQ